MTCVRGVFPLVDKWTGERCRANAPMGVSLIPTRICARSNEGLIFAPAYKRSCLTVTLEGAIRREEMYLLILAIGKNASFTGFKNDLNTLLFDEDVNGIGSQRGTPFPNPKRVLTAQAYSQLLKGSPGRPHIELEGLIVK